MSAEGPVLFLYGSQTGAARSIAEVRPARRARAAPAARARARRVA